MKAIVAENLSKVYTQDKRAIDSMSLSIEPGEIFGFLGPNGAGKTTSVKLLNGILQPTDGTCRVFDIDPSVNAEQVHQFSGVATEHAQMYDHMTGLQNLMFFGTVFGISNQSSEKYANALLESLELIPAKDQKLATYSTGMRQRLSLARAMIHHPKVLFLDEPTSGLDPESVQNVNSIIKNLAKTEGVTIFLCTHQLRYAQELCSTYGLIDNGTMLASGNLDELRALVCSGITVSVTTDILPENMQYTKTGDQTLEITVQSDDEIPSIVKNIVGQGGNIYRVSSHKISLEEIYFSLLKKHKGYSKLT